MFIPTEIPNDLICSVPEDDDEQFFVHLQFIGLLDKNGKEIWEGDIIENQVYDEDDECNVIERRMTRRVVKWQDGISNHLPHKDDNPSTANCNPQFVGELLDGYDEGSCNWSEFHSCEVVGNIYEPQTPKQNP